VLDIPFCVAGGIRSIADAETVLNLGADKISVNSPALERPALIDELVQRFGSQCVVIGIDTLTRDGDYHVYQYTGDPTRSRAAERRTLDWVREVQDRGAGEIVLNCMNQDGVRQGYDVPQLAAVRASCRVPLIASGGAGAREHFADVFNRAAPHPQAPKLVPDRHGAIWLPHEAFAAAFAQHAPTESTAVLAAVQRPIHLPCITTPVGRPLWRDRPSWFLVAEEDRMIVAETQRFMATRMGATLRTAPADHTPMVSAPDVVVDVILEAVRASA